MAPISSNDKTLRDDIGSEVLASANRLLFYPQPGPQTDLLAFKAVPEVLFGGARGGGKGLKLSEEVLTSKGWTTIEDLAVGDVIFDANGAPTTVLYKSEPTLRACYRLTFDNGQQIIADDVHRWITYSKAERVSNKKCSPEYREKRKASRPSRANPNPKNCGSQKTVTNLNKSRVYQYKEPSTGTMRDTQEIFDTLKVQNGREVNHAIKLAGVVQHPEKDLPIPPYVLGVWLGDGSRSSGRLTIGQQDSEELVKELNSFGYSCTQSEYDAISYKIERHRPFITELKELGVADSKHIPESYLISSPQQRLELLQGLFDTDGSCAKDGQIEFCNTNETLARGVFELLASLGVKPFITTKTPLCTNGKNGPVRGAKAWLVKATTSLPVFRLSRKKERLPTSLRETQKWHYITNVEPVDSVWTQCLTVDSPTHTFLVSRSFIPTHNTAALLGDFVSDVPVYKSHWIGVLFRRTYPELEEVIRQSFEFYPQTGATYNANEKMWKWPNGAKLYLRYMAHPRDATNYQGHQFTWIGFDELGNFAMDEGYQKIIATLRSPHNVPLKRIRATANPGGIGHGWVKERFQISNHPEGYKLIEVDSGLNRMFIPSRVKDNLILLKNDPSYIDRLKEVGSPEMVRAWLYGDWDVVAGAYFPEFSPEHVTDSIDVEDIPSHWKIYRAYDHGTYHPFCVLWYTFAGEDWKGIKKGTIVILREWYGGNEKGEGLKMSLVDVRDGIAERESTFRRRVEPGPADNQIFENHGGQSIADAFAVAGIYFARSDKARIPGWNQVRLRLREKSVLITRHCRHLIRTLPMLQHDEARPEDVDTRGEDHCFIGSTLVDTEYGQIRIDTMPENGNVYTKDGLRPYVNCGLKRHAAATVNIFFNNGQKIRCTPDHKFLTIDGRWVEAVDLMGEICYKVSICEPQLSAIRSKSLTELDTTGVVSISNEMGSGFIGRFGKPIMEPSQKDSTFIIATKIATIIKSKILNFFQGAITSRYTCRLKKGSKHPENVWTFPEQKRPNGINQKKVEHGIGNILKRIAELGSLRKIRKLFVNNAGQNLRGIKKQDFAQITAKPNGEDYLGLMTRTGPAQCVRQFTESINTHEKIPVQSNAQAKLVPKKEKEFHNLKVVAVEKAECADVYCLHVPSVENFSIEGGIIVHNCSDVLRYITMVWPVIPKYHREHKRSKDGNAPTWADLVDATDDVTRRWRL